MINLRFRRGSPPQADVGGRRHSGYLPVSSCHIHQNLKDRATNFWHFVRQNSRRAISIARLFFGEYIHEFSARSWGLANPGRLGLIERWEKREKNLFYTKKLARDFYSSSY